MSLTNATIYTQPGSERSYTKRSWWTFPFMEMNFVIKMLIFFSADNGWLIHMSTPQNFGWIPQNTPPNGTQKSMIRILFVEFLDTIKLCIKGDRDTFFLHTSFTYLLLLLLHRRSSFPRLVISSWMSTEFESGKRFAYPLSLGSWIVYNYGIVSLILPT